jgi:SAM-dependent methyltransferase
MDPAHLKRIEKVIKSVQTRYSDYWKDKAKLKSLQAKAYANSVKKKGRLGAHRRKIIAGQLLKFRGLDAANAWGRSFNAGLAELNSYWYKMDIEKELLSFKSKQNQKKPHVLEIGCGGGQATSELQKALGNGFNVSALGLKRLNIWNKYSNSKKVNWHVGDVASLSHMRAFPRESVDFIHSNIGLGHSPNPYRALEQCRVVLRKGGRVLFTFDGSGELKIPKGFKPVKGFSKGFRKNPEYNQLKIYYLEKV